jgi:serine phosphatase RsbU (regulator of sigma subunit)/anti-anti-sigma regulatory factor
VASSDRPHKSAVSSILIVDDDEDFRQLLIRALREEEPRHIEEASSAAEARAILARRPFDVVITDLSMPEEGGLSLMQWSQAHCPGPSWIVLTGYGTFDTAVKALQLGAFNFLSKPLRGVEPLRKTVRNALAHHHLLAERDSLHGELQESNTQLREHIEQLEEACHLLREQGDTIRADLHRAGIIQRALLPHAAPRLSGFHVHALYRPSQNVGGDLYDVAQVDDRHVALLIADAAGHGMSAAMLAVLFRGQLPFADPDSRVPHDPCDVLRVVNRSLCEGFPAPGLFLTAAYCLRDTESRQATVASAGHPPVLWLRQRGEMERIFHTGPALGLYPGADFTQKEIVLEAGDRLLLYSDGLHQRFPGDDGSPSDKIAAALQREAERGPGTLQRLLALSQAPEEEAGEGLEDDVTLLMLTATSATSVFDNGEPQPLPTPLLPHSRVEILVGADAVRTTLSIQGRGGWTQSAAFHAECAAAIEQGRMVMIDLTLCQHLDSTFLGTIHLLCDLAERADVEFRLQGVMPPVEDLFVELGMERVMDHIVPRMLPLPTQMEPLGSGEPDRSDQALLMLRAHEGLAALSDRNRREFDPLVALLRQEVAALTSR